MLRTKSVRTFGLFVSASALGLACAPPGAADDADTSAAATQTEVIVVQAEDYLTGGEGVGYHDTTKGNSGGKYRQDNVDIEATTDAGGGYDVGWFAAGEWLAYAFNAPAGATYTFSARVASHLAGTKDLHLEVDGTALPTAAYTDASGWQSWQTLALGQRTLTAGAHTLKLVSESGGVNVNYLDATYAPASSPSSPLASVLPAKGALWGFYSAGNSIPGVESMEQAVGRTFDVAKRYHDFSNSGANVFPTADEKTLADAGRVLHFAWETKIYNTVAAGMPAVGANKTYTFAQITSGQLDEYIDATAARLKAYGHPFFISFNHEQDTSTQLGGSNVSRGSSGTSAEYVAAHRYLASRFKSQGATNAIWTLVFSGYQSNDAVYTGLYPGDDVIDMIGWDPYNHSLTKWTMPEPLFDRFYSRLDAGLLGATAAAKPRLLGEYGCIADTTGQDRRPAWFAALPAALESLPKLKLIEYFDSSGTYEYAFDSDQSSVAAFAAAGHDAEVNQPHDH